MCLKALCFKKIQAGLFEKKDYSNRKRYLWKKRVWQVFKEECYRRIAEILM